MSIIDEQGRLFGRVNLIDAVVAAAVLVLAPIAYAAYVLFRPAPIAIVSVEPSRFPQGQQQRVHITGVHLRPYLRAQFADEQVHSFLIDTPSSAEAIVPVLPPGTYDLTLYDEADRVAVLKNAVTVLAPDKLPPVTVRLVGALVGLDAAAAKAIAVGQRLGSPAVNAEVLRVGAPVEDLRRVLIGSSGTRYVETRAGGRLRVSADLRVVCSLDDPEPRCKVNNAIVAPGQIMALGNGHLFVVDAVQSDVPGRDVDLVVQFVGRPEIIDLIKPGDRDAGQSGPAGLRVVSVQHRESVQGQTTTRYTSGGMEQTLTRAEPLAALEATLHVVADDLPGGLEFGGAALKVGMPFTLQTARYQANGSILRVIPARTNDGP